MRRSLAYLLLLTASIPLLAQQADESVVLLRNYGSLADGDERTEGAARLESFDLSVPTDGTLNVVAVSPDFAPFLSVLVNDVPALRTRAGGDAARAMVSVSAGDAVSVTVGLDSPPTAAEFADYLLSVVLLENGGRLTVGGSLQGTLTGDDAADPDGSYVDRYELELPPDAHVRVALSSVEFDAYLEVELPDGRVLENDDADGSDSALSFATGSGGVATVTATSFGYGSVGAYTLRALYLEVSAISVGELVEGELTDAEASYVLTGVPGEAVVIDLWSDDFDTYLELSDTDGTYLYNDDADGITTSRLVYEMGSAGEATVVVSSYSGDGGFFLLETAAYTHEGPEIADGYRLTDGEVIAGSLGPHLSVADGSYRQRFTFDLGPTGRAEVVLRSDDFDSYLTVIGPDGSEYTDDDSAGGLDSRVVINGGASGVYEVYASDLGGGAFGSYTLSFFASDDARLLLNTSGRLTPEDVSDIVGRYYDVYRFTVDEGRLVTIDVVSEDFDGYALVRSEDGEILYRDDDGGGGSNPRISFSASQTRTLELLVTTYLDGETGSYTVSIYE